LVATVLTTLLGAMPAAALPNIVTASIDACGGTPLNAAITITANRTPDDPLGSQLPGPLRQVRRGLPSRRGRIGELLEEGEREVRALEAAICNVQDDAAKATCTDALKAIKESVKVDYIAAGRDNGRAYCEATGLSTCLASCN
jgi:hypothetical protein